MPSKRRSSLAKQKRAATSRRARPRRSTLRGGYLSVDRPSKVPPGQQWDTIQTAAPSPAPNGGLYTNGCQAADGPHRAIPVTPTTTNMINKNLVSANPPCGATEQYPGTPRLDNNHVPMPGVTWYRGTPENSGPFRLKTTTGGKRRSRSRSRSRSGSRSRSRTRSRTARRTRAPIRGGRRANRTTKSRSRRHPKSQQGGFIRDCSSVFWGEECQ